MEEAIKLGVDTILTSGGKQNCIVGAETIRTLVEQAEGRIEILVGAGVSQNNIAELIKRTKTKSFHMSGKTIIEHHLRSPQQLCRHRHKTVSQIHSRHDCRNKRNSHQIPTHRI